ncbi:MAG: hypothetical protein WC209_13455 [Ignavibacteriaceae bacterium]|jgi:exopolyphosphatase/pppGpp-phosphohydrolase
MILGNNSTHYQAILDIGSNSFHFVVYQIEKDKSFSVVLRKRIVYRLALQKPNEKSFLSEDDFTQTEKIILELKEVANSFSSTITATATSAVREASNQIEFLERLQKSTGISVEVLSGEREAALIYKAVLCSEAEALSQNILCLDIGGGSTEFIVGNNGKIIFVESLKLGAVRLSSKFFPLGDLEKQSIIDCRTFIKKEMQSVTEKLSLIKVDFVTGNSGTIYAVKNLVVANAVQLKFEPSDQRVLMRKEIDKSVELLLTKYGIEERKTLPGVESDRADVLPAGALILQTIFHELNLSKLNLSEYSMREGKLLEVLESRES